MAAMEQHRFDHRNSRSVREGPDGGPGVAPLSAATAALPPLPPANPSATRWTGEGLRRLLRPGYGSRANARDAVREIRSARQQAWPDVRPGPQPQHGPTGGGAGPAGGGRAGPAAARGARR